MLTHFRKSTPLAQILYVILSSSLIALLIWGVWFYALRTPWVVLYGNLRSVEAATIIADLDKSKTPYRLSDGGSTIEVPADKADVTRVEISRSDLPLKGSVGFELFNKSDMGLTDFAQKINYQRALQGELARTIMSFDNVESARVHLTLGEDRLFREDRFVPKASVAVRMRSGEALPAQTTMGIQRLISASVPRLESDDVVVIDEAGSVTSRTQATSESSSPLADGKKAVEGYYRTRITTMLRDQLALESPAVSVRAQLTARVASPGADDLIHYSWDIDARDFVLDVTVDPTSLPVTVPAEEVQRTVEAAIQADQHGDNVHFGPLPLENRERILPPAVANTRRAAPTGALPDFKSPNGQAEFPTGQWYLWGAAAMAILLAMLAANRFRRPKRLSSEQQRSFAQELERALESGA